MSNEILLLIIGALMVAIVIHAYNMGWQAGHDIHHSDEVHRPEDPEPPRSLYI